jgi:hypothetical protein
MRGRVTLPWTCASAHAGQVRAFLDYRAVSRLRSLDKIDRMRFVFRLFLLIVLLAFIAIQLVPVARTNPTFDPKLTVERQVKVPEDVRAILDRSCKDCHSNETVWPAYAYVAPVSWLLTSHVRDAREKMNLSEWGTMDSDAAKDVLIEVCRQVKKGQMPLPSYTLIHRSAILSPSDVTTLCTWSDATRKAIQAAE